GGMIVRRQKSDHMWFNTDFKGGIGGFITSIIVHFDQYMANLQPFNALELLGVVLFYLGYGLVFTVVAQSGFFVYFFCHHFVIGFFKSFWPIVQLLLILLALFYMVYFSSNQIPLWFKVVLAAVVLITAFIVARLKVKKTNQSAFVPSLFVMIVITALELSLVLRAGNIPFVIIMVVTVLTATAYQLLILHEVTEVSEEHKKRIQERRKARLEQQKAKQANKKNNKEN